LKAIEVAVLQVMEGRIESGEVPYKAALAKDEIPAEYE
jgi:hypothetical protein